MENCVFGFKEHAHFIFKNIIMFQLPTILKREEVFMTWL